MSKVLNRETLTEGGLLSGLPRAIRRGQRVCPSRAAFPPATGGYTEHGMPWILKALMAHPLVATPNDQGMYVQGRRHYLRLLWHAGDIESACV